MGILTKYELMEVDLKVLLTLTWSKVMAFVLVGCSMALDLINGTASTFMFTVPFVSALILGKQYFDKNKPI